MSEVIRIPPYAPSQRLIDEAQTIIYRRWRQLGLTHDAALDHAAMFALRVASVCARLCDGPAEIHQPNNRRKHHMSERLGKLESSNFDLWLSLSEKTAIEATRKSSEAFAARLDRQIRRGRESAARGTVVEMSPAIGALRIRGEVAMSACGSPAAMCAESGFAGGAAAAK